MRSAPSTAPSDAYRFSDIAALQDFLTAQLDAVSALHIILDTRLMDSAVELRVLTKILRRWHLFLDLSIAGSALSDAQCVDLASLFAIETVCIYALNISYTDVSDVGLNTLLGVPSFSLLMYLDLSFTRCSCDAFTSYSAMALKRHREIPLIGFFCSWVRIPSESIGAIVSCLEQCIQLEEVSITGSTFAKPDDLLDVASAISTLSSMRVVSLAHSRVADCEAIAPPDFFHQLLSYLLSLAGIQSITLANTAIQTLGVHYLAECITSQIMCGRSLHLYAVDVSGCYIADDVVSSFEKLASLHMKFPKSFSLSYINLQRNSLSLPTSRRIYALCKQMNTVCSIDSLASNVSSAVNLWSQRYTNFLRTFPTEHKTKSDSSTTFSLNKSVGSASTADCDGIGALFDASSHRDTGANGEGPDVASVPLLPNPISLYKKRYTFDRLSLNASDHVAEHLRHCNALQCIRDSRTESLNQSLDITDLYPGLLPKSPFFSPFLTSMHNPSSAFHIDRSSIVNSTRGDHLSSSFSKIPATPSSQARKPNRYSKSKSSIDITGQITASLCELNTALTNSIGSSLVNIRKRAVESLQQD